jgi:hypothetical protein
MLMRLFAEQVADTRGVGTQLLQIAPPSSLPSNEGRPGQFQVRVAQSALTLLLLGDDRLSDAGCRLSGEEHTSLLQQLVPWQGLESSVTSYTSKYSVSLLRQHQRAMLALHCLPQPLQVRQALFIPNTGASYIHIYTHTAYICHALQDADLTLPHKATIIRFTCSGEQPDPEQLDAALRGMGQAWLDAHPGPSWQVLAGAKSLFMAWACTSGKDMGHSAASRMIQTPTPPPPAAAAAEATSTPAPEEATTPLHRRLLRGKRGNNKDAVPAPPNPGKAGEVCAMRCDSSPKHSSSAAPTPCSQMLSHGEDSHGTPCLVCIHTCPSSKPACLPVTYLLIAAPIGSLFATTSLKGGLSWWFACSAVALLVPKSHACSAFDAASQ